MQESTILSHGVEELSEALSSPARAGNVYNRRDKVGLLLIQALCRTPQEVDVGALVRGDLKTVGISIGTLILTRAEQKVKQWFVHSSNTRIQIHR